MKTRIIQAEPEPESAAVASVDPDDAGENRTPAAIRWAVIGLAVVGYFVLGLVHPVPDSEVGDDPTLFYWLHVVQPLLILLVAWSLWLLVEGLPGRAAQITRLAIVPYAIAYTMLDSIAGIATGIVIREADRMSAADAAVIKRMMDADPDFVAYGIWALAGLTWFVAAVSAAVAVKQVAGRGPAVLMAAGAAVFAVAHPFPFGPIGMALFGAGVVWLEVRRARTPLPEAQPALAP